MDVAVVEKPMVMMLDSCGLPRAWGIAMDMERAEAEAERQLALYIGKKRDLGEMISRAEFTVKRSSIKQRAI